MAVENVAPGEEDVQHAFVLDEGGNAPDLGIELDIHLCPASVCQIGRGVQRSCRGLQF